VPRSKGRFRTTAIWRDVPAFGPSQPTRSNRSHANSSGASGEANTVSVATVPVGSVWMDCDRRCQGRAFRVDRIAYGIAHCTILTDKSGAKRSRIGGRVTIDVGRFTPANYRPIKGS
jgi:hypothetical protein